MVFLVWYLFTYKYIFLVSKLVDIILCIDSLLISSIIDNGISEALSSIYEKYDYANLNHLIKNSLLVTTINIIILVAFLWIWDQWFLSLFNFNEISITNLLIYIESW